MKGSACFLLFLATLISACGSGGKEREISKAEQMKAAAESAKKEANLPDFKRIVVIGDEMLEILLALGDSNRIVAVSRTHSLFPHFQRPKVGIKNIIKAQSVLQYKPDAVFADHNSCSDALFDEIEQQGIPFFRLSKEPSLEATQRYIREIAKNLKKKNQGEKLIAQIDKNITEIKKIRKSRKDSLRVLYVHARGSQVLLVGGNHTPIHTILLMAATKNAASEFEGMERLTAEDMAWLNPDFIVMSKKGVASLQGKIHEVPALLTSTAYRMGRILVLDDYEVLNLGLSSGKTALEICKKLYKDNYYTPLPIFAENTTPDPNAPPQPKREKITTEPTPTQDEDINDLKGGN
jgi:iron complex transport system substrate-binding protein